MKRSKPGRVGCGLPLGGLQLADFDVTSWTKSGPPHVEVSLIKTEKASFAVGKSERSLAKCSIAEMTLSNVGWFPGFKG